MNATIEAGEPHDDRLLADKITAQLEAVRRRGIPLVMAFGVVLALALLIAALLPAKYRSAGTILIEQQEIPEDFVRSAVTSFADQRVQMISQRVMTSTNLLEIIEKHDLYGADRASTPREKLIERVRRDIELDMISANVVDPRRGGVVKATIAFSVAFNSRSPDLAARVANDLVSLYLRENLATRKQLAEGSAEFLAGEADRLRLRTEELSQQMATFKRDNFGRLPELVDTTRQQMDRLSSELREVDGRIRSFDQQIVFLDSQLAQLSPRAEVVTASGERLLAPSDRLKALRAEYTAAVGRYAPGHPDVRRLQREIDRLEREVAADAAPSVAARASSPDNPAYVQISAQREMALTERSSLGARRSQLQQQIVRTEQAQMQMPDVERRYRALVAEAATEEAKYAEIREKLMAAQLSQNLESEQKGERFTLIDPPVRPQEPVSPNRPAIAAIGFVLAIGAALGVVVLTELLDTRIRGRRQVVALLGQPPLAILPWVADSSHRPTHWWSRAGLPLIVGALLTVVITVCLVHLFVRPLDLLWATALRRFGA